MKIEFYVDYEILQKRGHSINKDLCLNRDGQLAVKSIELIPKDFRTKPESDILDGELIIGSVVNAMINIKYKVESSSKGTIFYCNYVSVRFYPDGSDSYINLIDLPVPENDLFEFYRKYRDVFDKFVSFIKYI